MKFKITICGDAWTVHYLTQKDFERKFGKRDTAYTIYGGRGIRQMWFNSGDTTIQTIRHEVTHAFMSYQYLGSTKISIEDAEEIFCDIIANRLEEIRRVSNRIRSKICKK